MSKYTISREDWSLHRKGEIDRQRHQEKVKEAIKKNLADIVSEERIISNPCGKFWLCLRLRDTGLYYHFGLLSTAINCNFFYESS